MPKPAAQPDAPGLLARGAEYEASNRPADAEYCYRELLENDPWCHRAYHALGLLAYRAGKLDLATELIGSAIALDDSVVVYFRDHGEICRQAGNPGQALASAERAVSLDPSQAESQYNLGLALAEQDRHEEAVAAYRRAIELDAGHGKAWNNLGSSLERTGDGPGAVAAYRSALSLDEGHAEARSNLGSLLAREGRLDEAREQLDRVLASHPSMVAAHFALSSLKRYSEDDPQRAALEALTARGGELSHKERTQLFFALGKARADAGEYDRAFEAFAAGNRLQKSTLGRSASELQNQADAIIELFTADFLRETCDGAANPDPTPVFVVGMPRSGTSLVEQILSSHSQVYGAGELKDLNQIVSACTNKGQSLAGALAALPSSAYAGLGASYLARLRGYSASARRIVDKMPANFFYLGLISIALPGARIIHTARDPMDSCWSCFCRLFNDTMEFSYDLEDLGRYYLTYHRLMRHWEQALPPGRLLTVRYEKLVRDLESGSRAMLEHIGLPWEEACLRFHENDRPVRTASLAQVRKPVYQSSIGAWENYRDHLQPLLDRVGGCR